MRRQRSANLPPSTTSRQLAAASARTAAVTSRSCRSSSVVPSASPTPASTPPASATRTSTICCSMASRNCISLPLWERAGVRGAYELERLRSYAPLTRAARGLSQRERHSGNAQVGALDADVGQQLGAAAFADDVALFEDVAAVSQLER